MRHHDEHTDQLDRLPADGTGPDPYQRDRHARVETRRDGHRPEFHEPPAQPTAFGAGTPAGAVAASALASGRPADRRDPRDEETVGPGDGVVPDDSGEAVVGTAHPPEAGEADRETVRAGEAVATPVGPLLTTQTAQDFRARWREVQLRFVDDPRAAIEQARVLVTEAAEAAAAALAARRDEFSGWGDGTDGNERSQAAVRHYRDLLERILAW
jgi:hypothetical protein